MEASRAQEREEERWIPDEIVALQRDGLYAETRSWASWMRLFTASDLADAMGISIEVARQMCTAAVWHGVIYDTGDRLNGQGYGEEELWEYVPLPIGPSVHSTQTPPEITTPGTFDLAPTNRGMPIRIRSERDMRRTLSTPGARQTHKMRELAYERQEAARAAAKEKTAKKEAERKAQGKKAWE